MRFAKYFAAAAFFAFSSSAIADEPQKGDLIDSSSESFRGWNVHQKAIGAYNQAFVVFEQAGAFLIAGTIAEKSGPRGGFEIERLLYVTKVRPLPSETVMDGFDCGFLGLTPAISFFNESTKVVTGYFATQDGLLKRRWIVDEAELCEYGGD